MNPPAFLLRKKLGPDVDSEDKEVPADSAQIRSELSSDERLASHTKSSNAQEPSTSQSKHPSDIPGSLYTVWNSETQAPISQRHSTSQILQPSMSQIQPVLSTSAIRDCIVDFYRAGWNNPTQAREITLKAFWEILRVLRDQFSSDTLLSSVLTITGNETNAQAATCEEFISQAWQDDGRLLLEGVESAVQSLIRSQSNEMAQDVRPGSWKLK
jgi:hypothetical protein